MDGLTARSGDHIVHLYRNPDDIALILGPYIAAGLRNHERCVLCGSRAAEPLRAWLAARGVKVDEAERRGQLVMVAGEPTAIGQNRLIHQIVTKTEDMGYPLMRLAGDGDGVLADLASPDELFRWEDLFDTVFAGFYPMVALCQFDLTRLRGDTVFEILRTHPLSVIGDKVVRNPFYDPPRQYGLTPREKQILQLVAHVTATGRSRRRSTSAPGQPSHTSPKSSTRCTPSPGRTPLQWQSGPASSNRERVRLSFTLLHRFDASPPLRMGCC